MNPLHDLWMWLSLGGYGAYVWGSVGMCALVAAAEVLWLRQRRRALWAELREEALTDTQATSINHRAIPPTRVPVVTQLPDRSTAT